MLRQRFHKPLDAAAEVLGSSVEEDRVLLPYDILANLAHVRMLRRVGLLDQRAWVRLEAGLKQLYREAAEGTFELDPALEDVHMNVESEMTRRLGDIGARLPTGRSRNDLVATDILLYLRDVLTHLEGRLLESVRALLDLSEGPEGRLVYPAATHLQDAQRVYLAQLLQVHAHRFLRDAHRLRKIREGLEQCPFGAGALAGSSLPLDPAYTASLLGFAGANPNSVDAVSDRDASAETVLVLALAAVHVSSLAEEWVLWSTPQFGRLRMGDEFVTTSSLMPHKRNPDMAELLRGQAAVLSGSAAASLGVLKGLPLSYNRDLQLGKRVLIGALEDVRKIFDLLPGMIKSAHFAELPEETGAGLTASVELVNALVTQGVPFRTAHERVASYLRAREGKGILAFDPSAPDWLRTFPELRASGWVPPVPREEPESRPTWGGSSRTSVTLDRTRLAKDLAESERALRTESRRLEAVEARLLAGTGPKGPSKSKIRS